MRQGRAGVVHMAVLLRLLAALREAPMCTPAAQRGIHPYPQPHLHHTCRLRRAVSRVALAPGGRGPPRVQPTLASTLSRSLSTCWLGGRSE